ncbi:hypothetical protein ACFOHU_03285 [Ottowia pentelensis]|uniref:DUF883 domain-containing protein n=1 Tax=Ottowia pentelensis TaxID=511108 RepID=A0ABV6PXN6_9BURK
MNPESPEEFTNPDAPRTRVGEALDKAQARLHRLREDVLPRLESLSAQMDELGTRGKAAARSANRQARQKLSSAADQTSAYVAEKPLQSMAIAAAAGAALALLLGRRRR